MQKTSLCSQPLVSCCFIEHKTKFTLMLTRTPMFRGENKYMHCVGIGCLGPIYLHMYMYAYAYVQKANGSSVLINAALYVPIIHTSLCSTPLHLLAYIINQFLYF